MSNEQKKGEVRTPDEDGQPDLECSIYQNYTASEVFVQGLAGIVNQQDVEAMIRAQKKMYVYSIFI
jgi:KxDL motif-containing protein 1